MRIFFRTVAIATIAMMMSVSTANAQMQGEKAIGGSLVLGTGGSYSHFGIGAKFLYNVTDPIRLGAECDFFLKKDYMTWWDFSVYGHYLFTAGNVLLYPLVGLGGTSAKMSMGNFSASTSGFVFTLGGGVEFELSPNLSLNLELRYKSIDFSDIGVTGNRTNFAAGLAYKF